MREEEREPPGFIRVDSLWTPRDRCGALRCRLGRFRMRYAVPPGLYALGRPGPNSPVIGTANYKLTFDLVREDLAGRDVWILVLNTRGINVWCAAAHGIFSTEEVVERVQAVRLKDVVSHRELTLPQLCAEGVQARRVQEQTGFAVRFGPVRSGDLRAYLARGDASAEMRKVRFNTADRLVLVPIELGSALKLFLVYALVAILFTGLTPGGVVLKKAWIGMWPLFALGLGAIAAGSVLVPILLPHIPFRAFAAKGWLMGCMLNGVLLHGAGLAAAMDSFLIAACWLFFPAAAAWLALCFTGATPVTSPSGVRRELRIALPFFGAAAVLTLAALTLSRLKIWGLL